MSTWTWGQPLPRVGIDGHVDYRAVVAQLSDTELRVIAGDIVILDPRARRRWCRRMRARWGIAIRIRGQYMERQQHDRILYWPPHARIGAQGTQQQVEAMSLRSLVYAAQSEWGVRHSVALVREAVPEMVVTGVWHGGCRIQDPRGVLRGLVTWCGDHILVYPPDGRNVSVPLVERIGYYPYTAYARAPGLSLVYGRQVSSHALAA